MGYIWMLFVSTYGTKHNITSGFQYSLRKLVVSYLSEDVTSAKILEQSISVLPGFVFHHLDVTTEKLNQPDSNIIIVDCRHSINKPSILIYNSILAIGLVDESHLQRERIHRAGYFDYLVWPIQPFELHNRFTFFNSLPPSLFGLSFYNQLVRRACAFMLDNISEPIQINNLCEFVHSNRNTLNEAFKQSTGKSPITWLREKRLELAAHALLVSEKHVVDIAFEYGFKDSNNFSTTFKHHFRMTPSHYRKKSREKHVDKT